VSETAKCRDRLIQYCTGNGLDLGCGDEKICPQATGVDWRKTPAVDVVGSVEDLSWVEDRSVDYIFSSHLLEHLPYPWRTLKVWLHKIRRGGYLVLYLPDRDSYGAVLARQGTFNTEHFWNPSMDVAIGMILDVANEVGRRGDAVHQFLDVGDDRYSFDLVVQVQ